MLGSGTIGDPYIIQNVTDLQDIENDLSAYYELEGDIDASATSGWNGNEGFIPIVNFSGSFDGKSFTISDLFLNRPTGFNQALFATIDNGSAIVRDVTLSNVNITGRDEAAALISDLVDVDFVTGCHSSGVIHGTRDMAGGLIGYFGFTTGSISECSSSCTVTADRYWAGGLIGYMDSGAVSKSFATGNVTSASGDAGGFVSEVGSGSGTRTIDDCYATGNVDGGTDQAGGFVASVIAGYTITNCYSTGTVTGNTVGGFCDNNSGTITGCFWDTQTSGEATSDGGTGKTTEQMKTRATFADAGWDI